MFETTTNFLDRKLVDPFRSESRYAEKPQPPLGEMAFNESVLFKGTQFRQFNPDKLIRAKGGFKIYDDMRIDDQIKLCLGLKKRATLATGWEVVPASEDAKDVEIAEFVEDVLRMMKGSFGKVLQNILNALDYGFSINEILWMIIEEGKHKGKVGIRAIKSKRPHYYSFDTDEFSNLKPDGLIQTGLDVADRRLPVNKFIIFVYQMEFGNWFGVSDLRSAYRSWWSKDNIIKFWNIYLERFGMPLALGKTKSTDPSAISNLKTILQNMQSKTSVVFPEGSYDIEFLEAMRRGGDKAYETALKFHDRGIGRSILIPDRLVEAGEVGAYAQSQTHFDVFLWVLQELRGDLEETAIQEQIIRPLVGWNFTDVTELPKFKFKALTEETKRELSKAFADAVRKGAIIPTHEDGNVLRDILGFPEQEEEPKETKPTPKGGVDDDETGEGEKKEMSKKFVTREQTSIEGKVDFQNVNNNLKNLENTFMVAYQEALLKQRIDLTRFVTKRMAEGTLTSNLIREIDLTNKGELRAITQRMFSETYNQGITDGKSELPAQEGFITGEPNTPISPDDALEYFGAKTDFVVKGIVDPLTSKTQKILLDSIRTGESIPDTVKELQDAYIPLASHQLEAIARTNMSEAYNYGRRAVGEDPDLAGFVIGYQFSEILDDRTTDVSRFVDGKIIDINSPALSQLTYPLHWNERGMFVYVTTDDEPVTFMSEDEIAQAISMKGI